MEGRKGCRDTTCGADENLGLEVGICMVKKESGAEIPAAHIESDIKWMSLSVRHEDFSALRAKIPLHSICSVLIKSEGHCAVDICWIRESGL